MTNAKTPASKPQTPAGINPSLPFLLVSSVPNVSDGQRATRVYFSDCDGVGSQLLKPLMPAILAALGLDADTKYKYRTDTSKSRGRESFVEMLADMAKPRTFQVEGAAECVEASWGAKGGLASFPATLAKPPSGPKG